MLREQLRCERWLGSADLQKRQHGCHLGAASLVTVPQYPATAGGAVFVTLENEARVMNMHTWRDLAEHRRRELLSARPLAVRGRWERIDGVEPLIAGHPHDLPPLLGPLETKSMDFR